MKEVITVITTSSKQTSDAVSDTDIEIRKSI